MKQIMDQSKGDFEKVKKSIFEIINQRGKMHNPVTNSGGVMLGKVLQIGSKRQARDSKLKVGMKVVPLCSISALPLRLVSVTSISGDIVKVQGVAVMNGACLYVDVPNDMHPLMCLSAIDVSRVGPLLRNSIETIKERKAKQGKSKEKITVLVIGTGKSGVVSICFLKKWLGNQCKILAVDVNDHNLDTAKQFVGTGDVVEKVNAQDVRQMLQFVVKHTGPAQDPKDIGADLVLSCVNVPYAEAPALVATKHRGTVLWFSMATQFDKVALGTDALAKEVELLISGGVFPEQAPYIFDLMRNDKKLWAYFETESAPPSKM